MEEPLPDRGSRDPSSEIESAFLAQRSALLRLIERLGARSAAEDILHEMWIRLPREGAPIRAPQSYLFRMAHSLVIDWERSRIQSVKREAAWVDATGPAIADRSDQPAADRVLEARETAALALAAVAGQGDRVARIFHRHRIDGLTQREVAAEFGISVGTVEADLRRAYAALLAMRDERDKA